LCRPSSVRSDASAAPLRIEVRLDVDWALHLELIKRKGPAFEGLLTLPSIPSGLEALLTPRLRRPSELIAARESRVPHHAVGSPASVAVSGPVSAH
jgi:protein ImuA